MTCQLEDEEEPSREDAGTKGREVQSPKAGRPWHVEEMTGTWVLGVWSVQKQLEREAGVRPHHAFQNVLGVMDPAHCWRKSDWKLETLAGACSK